MNPQKPVLLVIGAGTLSTPALLRLSTKHDVLALGTSIPQPSPDERTAWRTERCDARDSQRVLKIAYRERPCAVMSLNDFGMNAACTATTKLGLLGLTERQTQICLDKHVQKQFLEMHCLPTAQSAVFRDTQSFTRAWNELGATDCFIKPLNAGGGSRAVCRISSLQQGLLHLASHPTEFHNGGLVELPLVGTEHAVEVLLTGATWQIVSFCDKQNYAESETVVQHQIFPGPVASKRLPMIREVIRRLVDALGPAYGSLHLEVITSNSSCTVLEFSGRPGGSYNFEPVPRTTMNFDYPNELAAALLGETLRASARPTGFFVSISHASVPEPDLAEGFGYGGISLHVPSSDRVGFVSYAKDGSTWNGLTNDLVRPGYFYAISESADGASQVTRELVDSHQVVYDQERRTWRLQYNNASN